MWSGHTSASTIATCLNSQSFLRIFPISILFCPKNSFLRYFGANTIWYLQFQHVCAKLKLSIDIYLLSNSSVGPHEYCKEISFSGKTISSTSTPDYLGVLTRSAFAGLAQTKKPEFDVRLFDFFRYVFNYESKTATPAKPLNAQTKYAPIPNE